MTKKNEYLCIYCRVGRTTLPGTCPSCGAKLTIPVNGRTTVRALAGAAFDNGYRITARLDDAEYQVTPGAEPAHD